VGFPATQRCVAEHPVLIFLQVRAGRVKLIEFLRWLSFYLWPLAHARRNERAKELRSCCRGGESDGNAEQPLCLAIDIAMIYGRLRAPL
jgi:hypothetical protein